MNPERIENQPQKPWWQRYFVPLLIAVLAGLFELVNWTTDFTSEKLLPQFATSAQVMLGRVVFLLAVGAILIWILLTRYISLKTKGMVLGVVASAIGSLVACVREIENTGNNNYVVHFRWEKTREQRLAEFQKVSSASHDANATLDPTAPQFSNFLGPNRDGIAAGPALATDFEKEQPLEVWRRPVGGGYASCVMSGGLAVTIEQRGEEEVVVALDLATGKDRWARGYEGHFQETMGGNGPRATPTIDGSDVFALGAKGLLVALDLATGTEKWKTNILSDAKADNIIWGMSGAPLVVGDKVIVNPGGTQGSMAAYNRNTGAMVWSGGSTQAGYSSPILANLCGVEQVVIFDATGVAGYDLESGQELWRAPVKTFNGINIGQPLVLPNNQLFVAAGYGMGARLLNISRSDSSWAVETAWESKQMKCKMSSCVYFDGHIYGLDDAILACIDVTDGKRKWKSGRYGHGQILLRNDVLVIQAESGELVLVAADSSKHRELAKISMLPNGKTWNAPALAGNLLLLRNHFEAVLLKMPTKP